MELPPVPKAARRGLADEAAVLIRDAILADRFPSRAPLREVELAEMLGVSRGSVREALATLENEGLVSTGWHRGTTVAAVTENDVEEVYALRAALDRLAATTAQSVAAPADLDLLDGLVDQMAATLARDPSGATLLRLDIAFHQRVYDLAGNRRLRAAWRAIRSQVHLFQMRRVEADFEHYRTRVVPEHRELVALMRAGDREALARCAEEHVDSARRSLLAHLRSTP
jgi:DNA-binding GntR family transcriptional regulator